MSQQAFSSDRALEIIGAAFAAKDAEIARLREAVSNAEGMAGCMELLRDDLIRMGFIDKSVPPMFMTEAVCAAIRREVDAARSTAPKAEP